MSQNGVIKQALTAASLHPQETRKIKESVSDEEARKPALRQLLHKVRHRARDVMLTRSLSTSYMQSQTERSRKLRDVSANETEHLRFKRASE